MSDFDHREALKLESLIGRVARLFEPKWLGKPLSEHPTEVTELDRISDDVWRHLEQAQRRLQDLRSARGWRGVPRVGTSD